VHVRGALLGGVTARVPLKTVGIFRRVLAHLDRDKVRLLDCDTHHIIRDRQTCLAWPKTSVEFPPVEKRLPEHHFAERVTVSRSELRTSLSALTTIRGARVYADKLIPDQDDDKDFLLAEHDGKALQLLVTGEGSAAELSLHIRDSLGRAKGRRYAMACERTAENSAGANSPEAIDFMVDLLSLLKVVDHFSSPEVSFSVGHNSAGEATMFVLRIRMNRKSGALKLF